MSILITAAASAHAYQLKSILNTDAEILLGDYLALPDTMLKMGKMIKTPNPNSNTFIHEMLALCLDQGIAHLYPLRRAELLPLAEAGQLFAEFDIRLFVPDKERILTDLNIDSNPGDGLYVLNEGNLVAGFNTPIHTDNELLTGVFVGPKIFTAD